MSRDTDSQFRSSDTMMLTEFLIRLTVLHNPFHFSVLSKRYIIAVIIGILLLPAICTGFSGETGSTVPSNETLNLTITQPIDGYTYWIDVWPIEDGILIGSVQGQYSLKEIDIITDSGKIVCGNSSGIFCKYPIHEGANRITITVIDSKGNKVSETRNFTVNLGLPPPTWITLYGRVTDMFGKPIPNATVTVVSSFSKWDSSSISTLTSGDGSYRLEPVFTYQQNISVEKEGYPRKFWEKSFQNSTEFNMHIDIDRSISQGTVTESLSPNKTNASPTRARPTPLPMALTLLATGISFGIAGFLRKK